MKMTLLLKRLFDKASRGEKHDKMLSFANFAFCRGSKGSAEAPVSLTGTFNASLYPLVKGFRPWEEAW